MKKWTLLLVLIAITAFTSLAAQTMTYTITIYDGTGMMPYPTPQISGFYSYLGYHYDWGPSGMTYIGTSQRTLYGITGRIYQFSNTSNNGLNTYSANVTYRSKTSHVEGQCYMNPNPEFPYIYCPDPNTKPPEQ